MSINVASNALSKESIQTIMSELEVAASRLHHISPAVSIFGSARIKPDSPYYQLTTHIASELAKAGIAIIAGGGPGIMEAANKGAFEAKGTSIGLNISLPHESKNNPYQTLSLDFEFFCSRKTAFFMHSSAYIAMPGGFGTLDELFEALTLIQTGKLPAAPIILVGREFWQDLVVWISNQLLQKGLISPRDTDLFVIEDDPARIVDTITTFCRTAKSASTTDHPPI